ncbi:MAG: roadblock/LC7 domain-containing protein [Ottowia sp.]|nr:roadblock/LC7 domain-containing protein [Ottowia sp.]
MRTDMFQQVLEELKGSSADVEASALISTDGLMIASALPQGMDEDRVGAMSAALLSLGDRAARELARGTLERVLLQGERGYVIMSSSGQEAVLTVLAKQNAKLGLLFLDIKRAAEALSKLI